MPGTTGLQMSVQSRNRENQRRSRARRQEYIKELEQRILKHEATGVQATAQVQAAAKKVVVDNIKLRSLLGVFGISDNHIDEYLREGTVPVLTKNQDQEVLSSPVVEVKKQSFRREPSQQESTKAPDSEVAICRPAMPGLGTRESPSEAEFEVSWQPVMEHQVPNSQLSVVSSTFDTGELKANDSEVHAVPLYAADETSCEVAAHIIAGMRGVSDSRELWPELGCNGTRRCSVKNLTIFQMMDR